MSDSSTNSNDGFIKRLTSSWSASKIPKKNDKVAEDFRQGYFKNIVLGMEDALVVYDENFQVLVFNKAAEKLFTLKSEEVVGQILSPRDAESRGKQIFAQSVFPTLAPNMVSRSDPGEFPQIVDITFEDPYLELRTLTSPILDDDGAQAGFSKIIRDRTREIMVLKSKSEFISVASHQLRTPTTNLEWVLETISKNEKLSEDEKSLVENGLASARQMMNIVEDLLRVAKIEEGRFGYEFQETDLVEFLEKILAEANPQSRRMGISLFFDKPKESIPQVLIDQQKLAMAITNLLDNAIRYNVEGGKVTLSVGLSSKDKAEIKIRDTGIGIPESEGGKVFTKFFRATNAEKSQTSGSGLGLYIVKNIIREHAGDISFKSEQGRGTIFTISLPTDPTKVPQKEMPMEY